MPFGEMVILSEVRQRRISHVITYMWNLKKKKLYKLIHKTEIGVFLHRCRKKSYGYQWEKEKGGVNWEFGMDVCTLLYKIDN